MAQRNPSAPIQHHSHRQPPEGDLSRRQFFAAGGTAAGGLALSLPVAALGEQVPCEPAPAANQALPAFLEIVANQGKPASERTTAEQSVLQLNSAMQGLYSATLTSSKRSFRDQFPIIVALFSGQGGQMILYPLGKAPIVAERVPVAYELSKSVAHSPMAVYQVVVPYLKDPTADTAWKASLRTFRVQNQTALDNLETLGLAKEDRDAFAGILQRNIQFLDRCLEKGTYSYAELERFARGQKPFLERCFWISANAQVVHWMNVLDAWQKLIGKDWDKVYAVTNTLYGTRQNNILFTILAQYMGQEAINERLLLLETSEFTTTPEKMLDLLTRIVSDRALGKVFWDDYFLQDVELLSDPSRRAIKEQVAKRGMKLLMPTLSPFHSHGWPWRTDPTDGVGPSSLYEMWKVDPK